MEGASNLLPDPICFEKVSVSVIAEVVIRDLTHAPKILSHWHCMTLWDEIPMGAMSYPFLPVALAQCSKPVVEKLDYHRKLNGCPLRAHCNGTSCHTTLVEKSNAQLFVTR